MSRSAQRVTGAKAERVPTQARERKRQQRANGPHALAATAAAPAASSAPGATGRIASKAKRDSFSSLWRNRLPPPDPTLQKFQPYDRIGLYRRILHQFPDVAGYCNTWIDHVLTTDRVIKAGKGLDVDEQARADGAADRMRNAWGQVRNRAIVMHSGLMCRFIGFARAEKVWRFDEYCGEWIEDLYDVDQEAWDLTPEGQWCLITTTNQQGTPVDESRFIHFQWGTAETAWGFAELSLCYLTLYTIQLLEKRMLKSIEKYSDPTTVIHVPRSFNPSERDAVKADAEKEYESYQMFPTDEAKASVDQPGITIASAGSAGRQELDTIRYYQSSVQTLILGAPMTGNKSLGTGKLETTRQDVWDDKTPLGSSALDQVFNDTWATDYCAVNLADLPVHLQPYFESDSATVTQGLSGIAAQIAQGVAISLSKNEITDVVAVELWTATGISPQRARAMADSTVSQRGSLSIPVASPPPAQAIPAQAIPQDAPPQDQQPQNN